MDYKAAYVDHTEAYIHYISLYVHHTEAHLHLVIRSLYRNVFHYN